VIRFDPNLELEYCYQGEPAIDGCFQFGGLKLFPILSGYATGYFWHSVSFTTWLTCNIAPVSTKAASVSGYYFDLLGDSSNIGHSVDQDTQIFIEVVTGSKTLESVTHLGFFDSKLNYLGSCSGAVAEPVAS